VVGLSIAAGIGFGVAGNAAGRTLDAAVQARAFLVFGGGLWAIYAIALVMILRGRSYAFRLLLIGAFFGMFAIPPLTGGLLLMLNQKLDGGAAEEHTATIHRLGARKSRAVYLTSWRQGHEYERVTAPWALFRTLKVKDRVLV